MAASCRRSSRAFSTAELRPEVPLARFSSIILCTSSAVYVYLHHSKVCLKMQVFLFQGEKEAAPKSK